MKNFYSGDLFRGNTIIVYSRSLSILDYGDEFTRSFCSNKIEKTFGLIKPNELSDVGIIFDRFLNLGFKISKIKMLSPQRHQAEFLFNHLKSNDKDFSETGENIILHT